MGFVLRILVIGIALYLLLLLAKRVLGIQQEKRSKVQAQNAKEKPVAIQEMTACAHCGLHVPQDEAIVLNEQTYCCTEHATLGPKR